MRKYSVMWFCDKIVFQCSRSISEMHLNLNDIPQMGSVLQSNCNFSARKIEFLEEDLSALVPFMAGLAGYILVECRTLAGLAGYILVECRTLAGLAGYILVECRTLAGLAGYILVECRTLAGLAGYILVECRTLAGLAGYILVECRTLAGLAGYILVECRTLEGEPEQSAGHERSSCIHDCQNVTGQ